MKKKILLTLLAVLIIIQFIRPRRNQSSVLSANDITTNYAIPENVQAILKRSCNDCHSNTTVYPWYTNIQPVGWWLQMHVNDGKEALNFSEFMTYSAEDRSHTLEELIEEVKEGGMPLHSYLWMHDDAKLSEGDKQLLINWAKDAMKK